MTNFLQLGIQEISVTLLKSDLFFLRSDLFCLLSPHNIGGVQGRLAQEVHKLISKITFSKILKSVPLEPRMSSSLDGFAGGAEDGLSILSSSGHQKIEPYTKRAGAALLYTVCGI